MIYSCKKAISVAGDNDDKTSNKQLIFKNNAPFRSCISKINNTFTDNAEDLDIFMSIHNLLQYNDNYFMTSGSFWNYYSDKINDSAIGNNPADNKINRNKTVISKCFE